MLNLPAHPGATGSLLLGLGALAGLVLLLLGRRHVADELDAARACALVWTATGALAVLVAGAPYTTWRVVEDIRETVSVGPEHARYVGAETKLIDGELVQRIGRSIPAGDTYQVAVAPDAFSEIRASLARWMGYALLPRRQVREAREADWVVTWGAKPADLDLEAGAPRLVGRNRLVEYEPVYLARGPR